VSCTGAFQWTGEIPGASVEQLEEIENSVHYAYPERAVRLEGSEGTSLSLQPGRTHITFDGWLPAEAGRRVDLNLFPSGALRGTLPLALWGEPWVGWKIEGQGPPVNLYEPGETTVPVWIWSGILPAGSGTCRVSWALDESVHRSWTEVYVPRRH
jgi:hypothetical protein